MARRRIWLVISLLWVVGVIIAFNPIKMIAERPLRLQVLGYSVQYSTIPTPDELRRTLIDFLNHQRTEHPYAPWVKSPGSIEEKVDEVMRNYRPPPLPWGPLLAMSVIALLLPGFFLLGCVLRRGIKRRGST